MKKSNLIFNNFFDVKIKRCMMLTKYTMFRIKIKQLFFEYLKKKFYYFFLDIFNCLEVKIENFFDTIRF